MNVKLFFQDKALHPVSRSILKEIVEYMAGKGGWWTLQATQRQYSPNRYKYLFDCVYSEALQHMANRYGIVTDEKTGTTRPLETTAELHECMKWEFLSVTVVNNETGIINKIPVSSTKLEDKQFYQEFEEQVIAHLTDLGGFPDGVLSRERWAELKHPKQK